MTHLEDAHAALQRAVTSDVSVVSAFLSREQAAALLDEAARLVADRDNWRRQVDALRDEHVLRVVPVGVRCPACHGDGWRAYGGTSTWRGGGGGQTITDDVCDACWGSGRTDRTGADLRRLVAERDAARRERDAAVDAAHWLSCEKERLTLALEALRGELADLRARCALLERERDEVRAALTRVRAWCRRPEWMGMAVLAHVHGQRIADDVATEGQALWADVDRLLGDGKIEG